MVCCSYPPQAARTACTVQTATRSAAQPVSSEGVTRTRASVSAVLQARTAAFVTAVGSSWCKCSVAVAGGAGVNVVLPLLVVLV